MKLPPKCFKALGLHLQSWESRVGKSYLIHLSSVGLGRSSNLAMTNHDFYRRRSRRGQHVVHGVGEGGSWVGDDAKKIKRRSIWWIFHLIFSWFYNQVLWVTKRLHFIFFICNFIPHNSLVLGLWISTPRIKIGSPLKSTVTFVLRRPSETSRGRGLHSCLPVEGDEKLPSNLTSSQILAIWSTRKLSEQKHSTGPEGNACPGSY